MELKKIKYKIANPGYTEDVVGFAIGCDLPVRMCVRFTRGAYTIDHYDSGRFITVFFNMNNIYCAANHAVAFMRREIDDGSYAEAINRLNGEA
jgi:hypothetical protein